MTMGTVVSCFLICRQSSKPSILGMKTSEMTMSGLALWNFARASSPSPAAITKQLSCKVFKVEGLGLGKARLDSTNNPSVSSSRDQGLRLLASPPFQDAT
jgi:hypothetical protein